MTESTAFLGKLWALGNQSAPWEDVDPDHIILYTQVSNIILIHITKTKSDEQTSSIVSRENRGPVGWNDFDRSTSTNSIPREEEMVAFIFAFY